MPWILGKDIYSPTLLQIEEVGHHNWHFFMIGSSLGVILIQQKLS